MRPAFTNPPPKARAASTSSATFAESIHCTACLPVKLSACVFRRRLRVLVATSPDIRTARSKRNICSASAGSSSGAANVRAAAPAAPPLASSELESPLEAPSAAETSSSSRREVAKRLARRGGERAEPPALESSECELDRRNGAG